MTESATINAAIVQMNPPNDGISPTISKSYFLSAFDKRFSPVTRGLVCLAHGIKGKGGVCKAIYGHNFDNITDNPGHVHKAKAACDESIKCCLFGTVEDGPRQAADLHYIPSQLKRRIPRHARARGRSIVRFWPDQAVRPAIRPLSG